MEDYTKAVKDVTSLQFKGEFVEFELEAAQSCEIAKYEEKMIKKIVDKKVAYSTGHLFKLGIQVANKRGSHRVMFDN